MINVRFKKMSFSVGQDAMNAGWRPGYVPTSVRPNYSEYGVPRVNVVTQCNKSGKCKEVIRGLDGDMDSVSKNRNPKALIWRVYKILVNSQNTTAESMAKTLRASKDRITHAIRDLRRTKNGGINIAFENGYYRLAA